MYKISFVIPCYNSEKTITTVVDEIKETMTDSEQSFEIILVNDCSKDQTFSVIKQLAKNNINITAVNLAKNFGQHAAIMAGFNYLSEETQLVCCLDDDGQTPADEVMKLIYKIEEGFDVVYAKYTTKEHSNFRNFGSRINSMMAEYLIGKPKDLYVSSYFVARRFVVDKICEYEKSYPYLIGLVLRTTRNIANVDVTHRARKSGSSGYTIGKLISLWMNGFTAFSIKPLRIATVLGSFSAIGGFCFIGYAIVNKILNPMVPLGWSSMIASVFLIGGMILLVLGITGEYIGRIYISINNSPQYVVREIIRGEDYMYDKDSKF